jgi:hypothetical protein
MARRQPHPNPCRNRDHRPASTTITRLKASASTAASTRSL